MRFGKRLAEVTQNGRSNAPYVSYKDLKHILKELDRFLGPLGETGKDGDSSADEAITAKKSGKAATSADMPIGQKAPDVCAAPSSSSTAPVLPPEFEVRQREFFRRIDADVAQAQMHVQSGVSALELLIGGWQGDAVLAGILYTSEQLDDLATEFPFAVNDRQALLRWLFGLQSPAHFQDAKLSLIQKYSSISSSLNGLLQYIEVNLMAVRKILKKFERKVPAEYRMQHAKDYRTHHVLFMSSIQQVFATVKQMHHSVKALSEGNEAVSSAVCAAVRVSEVGPETLVVVQNMQGSVFLDEIIGASIQAGKIDVYAKPIAPEQPAANARTATPAPPASAAGKKPFPVGVAPPGVASVPATALQGSYTQHAAAFSSTGNASGARGQAAGGGKGAGDQKRLPVGVQPSQLSYESQPQKGGRRRGGQRGNGQRGTGRVNGKGEQPQSGGCCGGSGGAGSASGQQQRSASSVGGGRGAAASSTAYPNAGDWLSQASLGLGVPMQNQSLGQGDGVGYTMGAQGLQPYFMPMYVGQGGAVAAQVGGAGRGKAVGGGLGAAAGKGGFGANPPFMGMPEVAAGNQNAAQLAAAAFPYMFWQMQQPPSTGGSAGV